MSSPKSRQIGPRLIALMLLITGIWLVALSLGAPLIDLDRLWPGMIILAGLAMILQYARRPHAHGGGLIVLGMTALLSGLFLCMFTFQVMRLEWSNMTQWWPFFPFFIGIGFFTLFMIQDMRDPVLMVPAYIIGGIGILSLPFTSGVIGGGAFGGLARYWPVLLILVFIVAIFRFRLSRGEDAG